MNRRAALQRRLSGYWQMEAANALLVPTLAFYLGAPRSRVEAIALAVALFPATVLLLVGAGYWRGAHHRARGDARARFLAIADKAETPLLVAVVAAQAAAIAATVIVGWSSAVVATWICALLALLEFVNYYRVQLQHFDHEADFTRLRRGRGFRKAHLARDLASFREERRHRTRANRA